MQTNNQHEAVLRAAYSAWQAASSVRAVRSRVKRFAYGDQWSDSAYDPLTERVRTARDVYLSDGYRIITNNVMRPIIKTIVGRYRSQVINNERPPADARLKLAIEDNELDELDSRLLEEFLISGMAVQRVEPRADGSGGIAVSSVTADRFFVNAMRDMRGADCMLIGQLHDLSLATLLQRVARGSRRRAGAIKRLYLEQSGQAPTLMSLGGDAPASDFWKPAASDLCRAIEVWTLESREQPGSQWCVTMHWHCRWFSPAGDLLAEYDSPWEHRSHPFVFRFYPFTDGEIHPYLEDVIDQQNMINRMITVLDKIMRVTAKGVLLYPAEALPGGFTWQDITMLWSRTGSLIPYIAGNGQRTPQQISTNGTDMGAYEMIKLQMQMLERTSGVTGTLQGLPGEGTTGAALYQAQSENATMALSDLFDTFSTFRRNRNRRMAQLVANQLT